MPRLWKSYREITEFARNRAMALEIPVVVRRVPDGWILPYYDAYWNIKPRPLTAYEREYGEQSFDDCDDASEYWLPDESGPDEGEGSSGLMSNCGETLMEGYLQFKGD